MRSAKRAKPTLTDRSVMNNEGLRSRIGKLANPGKSTSNLDALHELDMVAGGDPKVFGGMGDSSINQSIGPAWNKKGRKSNLYNYAKEMCAKNCRMAAILSVCSILPHGDNWA